MNACPESEILSLYLLGQLDEELLEAVGEHLADCQACQEAIDEIDRNGEEFDGDSVIQTLKRHSPGACEETDFERLRSKLIDLRMDSLESTALKGNTIRQPINEPSLPRQLGQYELQECLGRGAMGIVFKAWHVKLKRPMALKLLLPVHHHDSLFQKRFELEMEAIGKLSEHPHIVHASDAGEENGILYLVMDYAEGCDVSSLLARVGKIRIADACEIVRQAALGLHHAHKHGILHRDVKPSNLLLTGQGQIKVMDLGLAIFQESIATRDSFHESLVGTADYMAPELWRQASSLGVELDVYSLGCTLFKLLVGHAPYSDCGRDAKSKRTAHLSHRVPSVCTKRPTIPAALDALVQRMLAKKPRERFGSIKEISTVLNPFVVGSDLKSLAGKVHNEHSDTQPLAIERTLVTRIFNTIMLQRPGRVSRRVFLLCSLAVIATTIALLPHWNSPSMEVLLTQDSAGLLWDYDRSKDLIHLQSRGLSMISIDKTASTTGVLETRIIPIIGSPDAGVFYGYDVDLVGGRSTRRFSMIGVRPQSSGNSLELYLSLATFNDLEGGLTSFVPMERGAWEVPFDEIRQAINLKLHFEDGRIHAVSCDETLISLDDVAGDDSRQTVKPIGIYGVYNMQGAAKFKRPRYSK